MLLGRGQSGAGLKHRLDALAERLGGKGLQERSVARGVGGHCMGFDGIPRAKNDAAGGKGSVAERVGEACVVAGVEFVIDDAEVKSGETDAGGSLGGIGGLVHVVVAKLCEDSSGDVAHGPGWVGDENSHRAFGV